MDLNSKHTFYIIFQSLQTKQEGLLSRMELLGRENEELSQQVATLEEEKVSIEDKLTELKVQTKELKKQAKANEVRVIFRSEKIVTGHCMWFFEPASHIYWCHTLHCYTGGLKTIIYY